MNGRARSITACGETLCHILSCQNGYEKQREERETLFNPNCPQNEVSHRIPLLSSEEFIQRSRLDFEESAGINASIGSDATTELWGLVCCCTPLLGYSVSPPGDHDSLIKYSYRQHRKYQQEHKVSLKLSCLPAQAPFHVSLTERAECRLTHNVPNFPLFPSPPCLVS